MEEEGSYLCTSCGEEIVVPLDPTAGGFQEYVVSGVPPFRRDDTVELLRDAPAVVTRRAPELADAFAERGWRLPASIDRVYDPGRAMRELSWSPRFGYHEVLRQLDAGSPEVLPAPGA